MNLVVGNFSLKGNLEVPKTFDFDIIESISKTGNKVIYFFGETEISSSKDFLEYLKSEFGEILNYDISISSEDKVEIFPYDYEEGIYELVSFEGEHIEFNDIKERFKEHDAIFSVREAEISKRFGNRVIKVDFVY